MNPRGWCARVRGERCQEPRPSLFADADEEQVKEAVISPPQRRVRNIASAVLSELRDPASRRQNAEGTSEPQPFRFREATGGERLETELDAVEHRSRQPCPGPAGPPTRKAAQSPVLVPEVYPNSRRPFPITPTCPADPGHRVQQMTHPVRLLPGRAQSVSARSARSWVFWSSSWVFWSCRSRTIPMPARLSPAWCAMGSCPRRRLRSVSHDRRTP